MWYQNIHTSVPTGPMPGLGPLDDGGHRHHRFLLLHHLGRLDLPVFTRHFYLLSFFVDTSLNPRDPTLKRNSRDTLVASSRKTKKRLAATTPSSVFP